MSLRLRTALAATVACCLSFGVASCGDDEPTPEEAQYQRVEELFHDAFGEEQAECMLRQFDDEMIASLDGPGALPEGDALDEFTAIARACVTGDGTPEPPVEDPPGSTEPDGGEDPPEPDGIDDDDESDSGADDAPTTTAAGTGDDAPTTTAADQTTTTTADG